jgi:hypothetical protein
MDSRKEILIKIHYFHVITILLGRKFEADSKIDLKTFRKIRRVSHKSSPKGKIRRPKKSTVRNRKSNSLFLTVEFFSIAVFFRGELL